MDFLACLVLGRDNKWSSLRIFTFIGVSLTIRYYKESDAQKYRTAVQPFLNRTVNTGANHCAISSFVIGLPTAKNLIAIRLYQRI